MTLVGLFGSRDAISEAVIDALASRSIDCRMIEDEERQSALSTTMGIDTAVFLGPTNGRPPLLSAAAETFQAIARSGARRAVVVSSAAITPPRHVHPGMIREARHPVRGVDPVADLWAGLEASAAEILGELELTILRPAAVPTPDGDDFASRLLRARAAPTFVGHDPTIQLLDAGDLANAIATAAARSRGGVYNVAPAGGVPLRKALSLARTLRLPLPRWLQRIGRRILAPVGAASITDADRIRYSWTVSGESIRKDLGFEPRLSSAAVAHTFADGRHAEPVPAFDDFGQEPDYIALLHRTILGFMHNWYWRVELAGIENVPIDGPGVLTGVHRGFMPFDGTMALYGIARETGRLPRFLLHRTLVKHPVLAPFMIRQGGLMACRENADWVLERQGLLGIYPEGIQGAFAYYRDAYRLRRDFGRDEFVKTALRNRAPIVPFVTVGSVEIFPVLAKIDWRWWQRFTEWPCFPIAPPFPLAPVPLPSKWHTRFLEPLPVHEQYAPEAAHDRAIVAAISADVRARMQAALDEMLARRKRIFFGSIFDREVETDRRG